MSPGKSKTHLNLHVNCPIFSPDFNKIWHLSTDCNNAHEHRISHKFVQWKPRCYKRRDGHTDAPQCSVKLTFLYRSGLGNDPVLATFRRHFCLYHLGRKILQIYVLVDQHIYMISQISFNATCRLDRSITASCSTDHPHARFGKRQRIFVR